MNKIIQANHGFTVSELQGKSVFEYAQEKYTTRKLLLYLFPISLFSFLILFLFKPSSFGSGFMIWIFLVIGIFQLAKYLLNKNRNVQQFSVDGKGFYINDNCYLREHVTGMFIQAWRSPQSTQINMHSTGMFIPVSSSGSSIMAASSLNAINAVGQIGDSISRAAHNKIVAINYRIFIRYGKKNIVLAKGITNDTAEVMLQKIAEVSDSYKK